MSSPPDASSDDSQSAEPTPSARYDEVVGRFVSFWGNMASNWGINRTMAEVYALLYCAGRPLTTDEIMERLQISRGSANMNLRALVDWGLAERTRPADSRKDHYAAETDVWRATARIIEERERREVRPVREQLQSVADHLVPDDETLDDRPDPDRRLHERLQNLIELVEVVEGVSEALLPLVKRRDEDLIRQLLSLAQSVEAPEADGDSSPDSVNA
jgi:DNA-binding transcriptional regulator GbsR (MarR family)